MRELRGTVFGYARRLAALLSSLINAAASALGSLVAAAPVLAAEIVGLQVAVALSTLAGLSSQR